MTLLQDGMSDLPEPDELVVKRTFHATEGDEVKEVYGHEVGNTDRRDSVGTKYDPDIHETRDGEPVLTSTGKFRKRRRTRKDEVDTALGAVAAAMTIKTCVICFGREWEPIKSEENNIDEFAYMARSYDEYFKSKNIEDFPPGVALSIALAAYAAPRLTLPETRSRTGKVTGWFKRKWQGWKLRRGNRHGARADSRNDGERQDNTGAQAGK